MSNRSQLGRAENSQGMLRADSEYEVQSMVGTDVCNIAGLIIHHFLSCSQPGWHGPP